MYFFYYALLYYDLLCISVSLIYQKLYYSSLSAIIFSTTDASRISLIEYRDCKLIYFYMHK